MGDGVNDPRHLAQDAGLVDGLEAGLVVGRHERAHRGQGRGQRQLEAAVGRDDPVPLELREGPVRRDCDVGVAEVVEGHAARGRVRAQAHLGQSPVAVVTGGADLELGARAEHRVLPEDPVRARTRLPVGDPSEAVAQRLCSAREDLFGAAERDAADEVHAGHGSLDPRGWPCDLGVVGFVDERQRAPGWDRAPW